MFTKRAWGSRMLVWVLCLLGAACAMQPTAEPTAGSPGAPTVDAFLAARLEMVDETIQARGVANPDVLRAMRTVPRHAFVPQEYLDEAYGDHPLPIGYGQTISQPYIVAWMTELLALQPGEKVLEIGTGSGYQAAVLAELGYVEVYSLEIVPELAERSASLLDELGYTVQVKQADGYYGWLEHAPFDAIIVTAAPDHLPAPLAAQLVEGGRLVIPIGPPGSYQSLWKFVKQDGELKAFNLGGVAFVPFTGQGVLQATGAPTP
ncbi:MAG: protein-L-isoaspartate(D-aspartate) O-methyltransferase [Chloroflexota bacterium]